jgi:hypothetical protein
MKYIKLKPKYLVFGPRLEPGIFEYEEVSIFQRLPVSMIRWEIMDMMNGEVMMAFRDNGKDLFST